MFFCVAVIPETPRIEHCNISETALLQWSTPEYSERLKLDVKLRAVDGDWVKWHDDICNSFVDICSISPNHDLSSLCIFRTLETQQSWAKGWYKWSAWGPSLNMSSNWELVTQEWCIHARPASCLLQPPAKGQPVANGVHPWEGTVPGKASLYFYYTSGSLTCS